MDCSPPGSSVHGILQARILEWVAISFSKEFAINPLSTREPVRILSKGEMTFGNEPSGSISSVQSLSRVRLFVTPWIVAHQAPLSREFSRQEYRSGLPFPPPGNLSDPGIKPEPPALQADSLPSESPGKPPYRGASPKGMSMDYSDEGCVSHSSNRLPGMP